MTTATYEDLLVEALPRPIETDRQYTEALKRVSALVRKGHERSKDETQLMKLLSILVSEYDRRNGLPEAESTPAERLQFLMEHSGKKNSDLLSIFGQRSHVSEALSGKRSISTDQARKLGKLFAVKPGLFV